MNRLGHIVIIGAFDRNKRNVNIYSVGDTRYLELVRFFRGSLEDFMGLTLQPSLSWDDGGFRFVAKRGVDIKFHEKIERD